jgi:hypothetical protein
MATNFPTNIDTFTDQTSSDLITSAKWNNLQDAIEALEVKVGADNSAVTTSHDYKLAKLATIGKIKARAYRNAAQDINAYTEPRAATKILIDTISFDTEGVVDTTNSRIIPNLPGYYVVMGNVRANAVPAGHRVNAQIWKNGELVTYGTIDIQGAEGLSSSIASDLIYMNGTTDYLELYAFNSHLSALALLVGAPYQNYISILGPF